MNRLWTWEQLNYFDLLKKINIITRHGAWLSMGNLDLHLIKGRPAVHSDDDLIVSHIAITVTDMKELTDKLKALNVKWRKNISVPNPSDDNTGIVNQVW